MIKIDKKLINPLKEKALASERKRCNHNFHEFLDDSIQRLLNVLSTNTYIRPHKHENPDKREAFIILEGKAVVIEFNDEGTPIEHTIIDPKSGSFGCEIAPRTWHTIICLEDVTVVYELKDGPYIPINDKDFAVWAPAEGDKDAIAYNKKLLAFLKIEL